VDELTPGEGEWGALGRTRGQAVEVDGRTFLTEVEGVRAGDIVEVEIVDADDYDLTGRVLNG